METAIKRVFVCDAASTAHILCNRLVEHGVRARVVGDLLAAGQFGVGNTAEIWADARDSIRAHELLVQWNAIQPVAEQRVRTGQFGLFAVIMLVTFSTMLLGVIVVDPHYINIAWTIVSILFALYIAIRFCRRS